MAARVTSTSVEDVKRLLDEVLGSAGFARVGSTQWIQGRGFDRWMRANSWKREIFEIDYPKRGPVGIGAKTFVRILAPEREVLADAASVTYLARGEGGMICRRLPRHRMAL